MYNQDEREKWIDKDHRYSVSADGDVYTHRRGKRRLKFQESGGYNRVYMMGRWCRVDKIVAWAFIKNPKRLKGVRHKDGDKGNDEVWNLEWVEREDREVNVSAKRKEVEQIKDGEVLYCFGSVKEAGECMVELGLSDDVMAVRREISRCARGERRRVCGYEWRYLGHKIRRREMRELYEKHVGNVKLEM